MIIRPFAICQIVLVLCVVLIVPGADAALPLVDHVPGDAVLYIGWAGAHAQAAAYQSSDLRAFIDHSNLPELASRYFPKYFDQLTQGSRDPAVSEALRKALPILWWHPVAVYLANLTSGGNAAPDGDLAMICDAGADAAELQSDLQTLMQGHAHLHVAARQSLVIVGLDQVGKTEPDSTLASNPAFVMAMQKLPALPAVSIYIDGKTLLAKLNESAAKDTHRAADLWPKVRDALGISNIGTIAMTSGFSRGKWETAGELDAPAPRTGLLAAIEPRPIDPALLARIPASADAVSLYNLDLAKLYDTLGAAIAVDPQSDKLFHQLSGAATVVLGANLRRQILGPLGSQWVLCCDPVQGGLVLMNHPTNPPVAGDSMVSVIFGMVNEINSQIPGAAAQPVVTAVQSTVKHVDLTTAQSHDAAPTVAVSNGILYLGLNPDSIVSSATMAAVQSDVGLFHMPAFESAVKRSGISNLASFSYCDLPVTAPRMYANVRPAVEKLSQILKPFGAEIPQIQLPPVEQLHLSPALSVTWADDAGFHYQSISPFPLSAALLGDPQQTMLSAAALSGTGSILIPTSIRSRWR